MEKHDRNLKHSFSVLESYKFSFEERRYTSFLDNTKFVFGHWEWGVRRRIINMPTCLCITRENCITVCYCLKAVEVQFIISVIQSCGKSPFLAYDNLLSISEFIDDYTGLDGKDSPVDVFPIRKSPILN